MKSKKIIAIFLLLIVIFMGILNIYTVVYADNTDVATNPDYYKPSNAADTGKLEEKAGIIIGYINNIGIVVSVVTLMITGIKYMLGSVEEKAEYKKTAIMYFIGAILIFGITTIPNILYNIGKNI